MNVRSVLIALSTSATAVTLLYGIVIAAFALATGPLGYAAVAAFGYLGVGLLGLGTTLLLARARNKLHDVQRALPLAVGLFVSWAVCWVVAVLSGHVGNDLPTWLGFGPSILVVALTIVAIAIRAFPAADGNTTRA